MTPPAPSGPRPPPACVRRRLRRCGPWLASACLLLAGCGALPTPGERGDEARALMAAAGWQPLRIGAGRFVLQAARSPQTASTSAPVPELAVFIEGDGLAWRDARTPSDDPTPLDPVALRLALAGPHRPAAWLARPCQYDDAASSRCTPRDWTDARWSPEVVDALDAALDRLRAEAGARRLVLVGYSGGGALAALLAARRDDVARLVTVAAVLDAQAWTRVHGLTPLTGSLDPASAAPALATVPQWHFVGADDMVTGLAAVQPFIARLPAGAPAAVQLQAGFDHACCWARDWHRLSPP
ncbi:MAG: alpha/beta fold hydrolase [Burkholderiales bacterium]|nr:alpha/beta fold hydrolase [Burkholderiales bacterium]